ncbi:MAG: bifunctional (p)ppGpp synthetase/guanosine-3',5'-bis(diphosphate) 3'-pyrophosphohydrolase [Bacilli bacterium]
MEIDNKVYTFDGVIKSISEYIKNEADLVKIKKAYEFAKKKHDGQFRKSGDPYITHTLGVAFILSTLHTSPATIIAGFLHDTIEDTDTTKEEITKEFGLEVAFLVESLTKITRLSDFHNIDFQAEDHRKIFIAMAKDIRVIIIKLADRLHNMRTLQFQPPRKQERISKETLDVYVPIAHRLGLNQVKSEMENLCLYYLKPDEFKKIENELAVTNKNSTASLRKIRKKVTDLLDKAGIEYEISSRVKSIYSIYKKMYIKNYSFKDIYDILALRIITKTETNCYEILGYIHSAFIPVPGRFKDYIAMPKPNLYQSLHTTILSGDGHVFEIQIRTKEMDETAEGGVAAHWRYKEGTTYDPKKEQKDIEERLHWFKDFVDISSGEEGAENDAQEFVNLMQKDIFSANVYVFTPKGKVISLPNGATPIDFAYRIHTRIGDSLYAAKVNNKLVPLSAKLKTGDIVEVETKKGATPNSEWLNIAQSNFAKSHIRKFLSKQNAELVKDSQIEKGRISLADSLKERKIDAKIDDIIDSKVYTHFKCANTDEFYLKICNRNIMPQQVIDFLKLEPASSSVERAIIDQIESNSNKVSSLDNKDVVVLADGDSAMMTLATCCSPIPGDEIIGYITKGRGITVHRVGCPNIAKETKRLVDVKWNKNTPNTIKYPVDIVVECYDRPNLVVDVMNKVSSLGATIINFSANYRAVQGITIISLTAMVVNLEKLKVLFKNLEQVKSVYEVRREFH